MKKALIFGISGFVGKYLKSELVENGYTVYGCDRYHSEDVAAVDITDRKNVADIVSEIKPDYIVNLAAISSVSDSWKNKDLTFQINVDGSKNILDAVVEACINPRMLFIGSSEEYAPSDKPISEDMPLFDNNPYGRSKIEQEELIKDYRKKFGYNIKYARSFNHIGIGQNGKFVIPSWCRKIAEIRALNKPKQITVGNVEIIRDFSDVRDVVNGYRLLLEDNSNTDTYNIGSGVGIKLRDILEYIIKMSHTDIEVVIDQALLRPTDIPVSVCDNSLIKSQLSWSPKYNIFDTVRDIFNYYLNTLKADDD
jgi:GDP-4-dehydro-6-deoxy-D-mannose reductase